MSSSKELPRRQEARSSFLRMRRPVWQTDKIAQVAKQFPYLFVNRSRDFSKSMKKISEIE